jgi:hypothetical protein
MGEMRNGYKVFVGKSEEVLSADTRIILKCINK